MKIISAFVWNICLINEIESFEQFKNQNVVINVMTSLGSPIQFAAFTNQRDDSHYSAIPSYNFIHLYSDRPKQKIGQKHG